MNGFYNNKLIFFRGIFITVALLMVQLLCAQRPVLQCIKRDTLLWVYGANACGSTTTKVLIYAARNLNGPYQLVDSVQSNITSYYFNNPDGEPFYYFLRDKNNTGGSCYTSDTLSNQPPQLNPVLTLNVLNKTNVEVRWRKNPSPQVTGYIVYKKTISGLVPIAKIPSSDTLSYIDTNAKPNLQSEEYQVLATDQCGNTSLFDQNHKTILLKAQQSRCTKSVKLNWNLYNTWSQPIAKHEVWLSQSGRNPFLLATLGGKDTTYTFTKLQDKAAYSFFVKAIQSVSGISARSNDTAFIADAIVPVDYLFFKNATVNTNNTVNLYWNVNATAKVDSMLILRAETDSTAYKVIGVKKLSLPIEPQFAFTDSAVNTRKPNYYRIITHDICGVFDTSNIIGTVALNAVPVITKNSSLLWTPFVFPAGDITGYQVTRLVINLPTDIGLPLDTTARTYSDKVGADEPNVCYQIGANFQYALPDGTIEEATSLSNIACTEQIINIWVPNAFTPDGKNPEFKAQVVYPENIADYQLTVTDRWGGLVFNTTDFTAGWNGRRGLTDLPQGGYMYYIRATQKNGNVLEKTGVVILLR